MSRIEIKCPFCIQGKVFFNDEGVAHAGHTTPSCPTFDEADDALDFIVKVNAAIGTREALSAAKRGRQ